MRHLLYLILLSAVLVACSSEEQNEQKKGDPFRKNLVNPFFIDQLFQTPNFSGSPWLSKHVKQLNLHQVSILMKGGSAPDNVLERFIYTFNTQGENDTFFYYNYSIAKDVLNETNLKYEQNQLAKIDIIKYYKIGNLPPVLGSHTSDQSLFYISKSNGKNDSLFFYPSKEQPEIIIEKVGNYTNYVEIIVPKETAASFILDKLARIDSNLVHFELAEKLLTYTENGYPIESYHLGESWNQMELAKKWEYNKCMQPINFKQWMHGTLTKDITITYNENSLPKRILYNRKKYYLIYK